jgi:hypothetical protein
VLQDHTRRCYAQPVRFANMVERSAGLDLGLRVQRSGSTGSDGSRRKSHAATHAIIAGKHNANRPLGLSAFASGQLQPRSGTANIPTPNVLWQDVS